MEARSYRFRLDVTPAESARLHAYLDACHALRNRLVDDRRHNREFCKDRKRAGLAPEYLSRADQYEAVSLYAKHDPRWERLHSQVMQNIACRVDEGYRRFFEALAEGRPNVNPPGFINRKKYRSFTFPQYGTGARLRSGRVILSGLGVFPLRDHRKVRGLKKTVTVKWMQGHWWVVVVAMIQAKDQYRPAVSSEDVGIDPGISALLTTSHGETFDPPRAFENARKRLRTEQKKFSRQFEARKRRYELDKKAGLPVPATLREVPYSHRMQKQIRVVAKLHTRVFNVRDHHHKKTAAHLASRYHRVAVEEHGLQFMIRNRRLAKAASDRAIGNQKLLLKSRLGERYIPTSNRREGIGGNSQTCLCGASVPKKLSDRRHHCPACGLTGDRDHVSANIVQKIAFGTISDTLGHPGRMSSDVESAKPGPTQAGPTSRKALERSAKRRSLASTRRRSTPDGKPAGEGETGVHLPTGVGA
ncbi:RNA-guided endonuclease InsQ/TnpB family protein [Trichloromonas sp.]|uniref:RNA-guided endonuclease InsQ/TnpB family protein n=1 Tax=Trichloromonas sp. TaxID=3069249 RepID=UPI002A466B8B|nr:transposase [Trichloromonas sp.]